MQAIERIRQTAFRGEHLLAGLAADDRLKIAHHHRVRVRAGDGADAVERRADVGHPVAQRLVHRVLERLGAGLHRHDLGAEHVHAKDVLLLPLDVDRAHVDDAFEPEARAQRRGRDAVHAGAGLGDDALLAHAPRQQDLAEHVVDLVRAGVIELFALQINLGAAARKAGGRLSAIVGQPLGEIERRRASDIMREIAVHFRLERGIGLGLRVGLLQFQNQRHQRFGHKAAAVNAEMPVLVRPGAERIGLLHCHAGLVTGLVAKCAAASRAARTNVRILSGSFSPGARSTPEETSTPGAAVTRKASPTLPA